MQKWKETGAAIFDSESSKGKHVFKRPVAMRPTLKIPVVKFQVQCGRVELYGAVML